MLLLTSEIVMPVRSQVSGPDRERGHVMLNQVKDDIKGNYYDPTFRGLDLDARFKAADQMLDKATSLGQIFGIIAQTVVGLNDSHTFFVPPGQTVRSDYGWQLQAIGDKCYVVAVKPGSDAEAKGLKPGDEVLAVNGIPPARDEMWKFRYLYYQLRPQAGMRLVVKSPGGEQHPLDVLAKVRNDKRRLDFTQGWDIFQIIREIENENQVYRHRYTEVGNDVFIWKMPVFGDPDRVDSMMDRVGHHEALILDLRGNSGGAEETLLGLIGRFFDKEIAVGSLKRRKESRPLVAKTRGKNAYRGKLVVLVDSESASAAELFARIVQLEKRGVVIGDRSAGAVMRGRFVSHQMGMDVAVFYGMSVTDADLIMTDGKSLERSGVLPDELMLLTGKDLAGKEDPVLSRAAELVGVKLDPAKAGAMFPREWVKQN
jgi:carboxyl-terminal processing protease